MGRDLGSHDGLGLVQAEMTKLLQMHINWPIRRYVIITNDCARIGDPYLPPCESLEKFFQGMGGTPTGKGLAKRVNDFTLMFRIETRINQIDAHPLTEISQDPQRGHRRIGHVLHIVGVRTDLFL